MGRPRQTFNAASVPSPGAVNKFIAAVEKRDRVVIDAFIESYPQSIDLPGAAGLNAIMTAAHRGYADYIFLLASKGADVNATTHADGHTPLMIAAREGYEMCFKALLKQGARLDIKNRNKETVKDVAKKCNRVGVLAILETAEKVRENTKLKAKM